MNGALSWLKNSAKHHLAAERDLERRCEKAYTKEPIRSASLALAKAHAECAAIWEKLLKLEAVPTVPMCARCGDSGTSTKDVDVPFDFPIPCPDCSKPAPFPRGLGGEHLRPDGKACSYLAFGFCNKCGGRGDLPTKDGGA